ncbi:MAG: hypothetical protein L0Y37_03160 [Bacteroidales bacterium]|nr:hypothetical protein [Bacteroidales bacterium]
MNKKALLGIEIIWITLGILCLVITVREMITNGFGKAWIFLIMSAAAFTLAWIRDRQRKNS